MQWLQDKKNLPIVIGLVVVVIAAAVFFLIKQISGGGGGDNFGTPPAESSAQMQTTPSDGSLAPVSGQGDSATVAQAPAAPPVVGGTTPSLSSTPGKGAGDTGEEAGTPGTPGERWRLDPFADSATERKDKPVVRLRVPMPSRLFPPTIKPPAAVEQLTPQPPRRVAGILHGDRVNALIQTPDGWEVIRPGERLKDGSIVERIERDRVILKTVSGKPEYVEVRLAASLSQIESSAMPTPGNMPGGVLQRGGVGGINPSDM